MVILDAPYVSDFLAQTLERLEAPVLDTPFAREALAGYQVRLTPADTFRSAVLAGGPVYTNSENAIDTLAELAPDSDVVAHCDLFKDKIRFRERFASLFPGYRFQGVDFADLEAIDPATLPMPLVVKPARGFFSLGVHVVASPDEWHAAVAAIREEVAGMKDMYPEQVLDAGRFVIEQFIEGDEYAVDVYFDGQGQPVILNILAHHFDSSADVSDRVYISSVDVVRSLYAPFMDVLDRIGQRAGLRNFPMHAELRIDSQGNVAPIEINPLRFAGWCCTDVAWHAFGINPYEYYLKDLRPDWDRIFEERKGQSTALVVADLPAGLDRTRIRSVDYDRFQAQFSEPLELRKVDYSRYSVFAFLFGNVQNGDMAEYSAMLGKDLTDFLILD